MLDTLRRGASGWVAKILLTVLVASFALWGVPEFIRKIGPTYLAKVGSVEISPQEFQSALRTQTDAIAQQIGRRLTPDQLRQYGFDQRILSQLIGSAALDVETRRLGLRLSDATLVEELRKDRNFQEPDGKFSKQAFDYALRQLGLDEKSFFALRRKEEAREMLIGALSAATVVPAPLVELLHAHRDETRTIEHFTLDAGKVAKVEEPDEGKLKEAYEKSKAQFKTPEYRKFGLLLLSVDKLKGRMAVADDELKAAFDAEPERYNTPEQRHLMQIAFKDAAAAAAGKAALASGKSFTDVAAETGAKASDIDLGKLTRKQLIDPKIAEVAFALPKGGVSDVVQGRFATVIVMAKDIVPGVVRKLEDVKEQIKDRLATEKAQSEINKLRERVDDMRLAQKPLAEIASALQLEHREVDSADRDNKTPDGKTALDLGDASAVLAVAFDTAVGVDHEPAELADGGYAWVAVQAITAPRQKAFDEVKAEVKTHYLESEQKRLVSEAASKLVEKINSGERADKLAQDAGGKVDTAVKITRTSLPQGLPQAGVTQAFALPKGRAGATDSADGKSRVVFKVVDIFAAAPPTKEQAERIAGEVGRKAQEDTIAAYVAAAQSRAGVTIEQSVLKRVLGGDTQ